MENSYKKKSNEKLDSENAEQHLENNETPTKKANRKKVPLHSFFKFCGVSDQTLAEAAVRYEKGFFSNVAFIFKSMATVYKHKTVAGKIGLTAKIATLPYYLIARKPIKAIQKWLSKSQPLKPDHSNVVARQAEELELVKTHPALIEKIINPNEETQLAAVKQQGSLVRFIKKPTPDVAWEAVTNQPTAIQFIKNAPFDLEHFAIKEGGYDALLAINDPNEKHFCALAIEHPLDILKLDEPSSLVRNLAIDAHPSLVAYINPTEEEYLRALQQHKSECHWMIFYKNHNVPEIIQQKCLEQDVRSLRFIKNPTDDIIAFALMTDYKAIDFVDRELNPNALQHAGLLLKSTDIGDVPTSVNGKELTLENRIDLLDGLHLRGVLEDTEETKYSLQYDSNNVLVIKSYEISADETAVNTFEYATTTPVHISSTNLIENSVDKPLIFDIEACKQRITSKEELEIIKPELGMKLPF